MTVIMPGHEPMLGTVRWVAGTRFGIQTDREIETMRLRAAHNDQILAADSTAAIETIPPPRAEPWRPGLTSRALGHYGRQRSGLTPRIEGPTSLFDRVERGLRANQDDSKDMKQV